MLSDHVLFVVLDPDLDLVPFPMPFNVMFMMLGLLRHGVAIGAGRAG